MTATLAQKHITTYDTNYNYNSYTSTGTEVDMAAVMATVFVVTLWAGLISYIITAIFLGMIFKKTGQPAWKAWVPFYNNWTLLTLGGQNGIWAVLAIIPVVNIVAMVFMYIAMYYIGKGFSKPSEFVLWAIFLPIVWLIWLATDKSTWKGVKLQKSRASS